MPLAAPKLKYGPEKRTLATAVPQVKRHPIYLCTMAAAALLAPVNIRTLCNDAGAIHLLYRFLSR